MRRIRKLGLAAVMALALATTFGATTASAQDVAVTGTASSLTGKSATLHGEVNVGGDPAWYAFQYGPTLSYGGESETGIISAGTKDPIAVMKAISGLELNTTYHYRLVVVTDEKVWRGEDKTFTTPDYRPVVTAEPATFLRKERATLNAMINPMEGPKLGGSPPTYQFEYGTTTSYGSETPAVPKSTGFGTSPVPVSETITGLASNTVYHYRVVATNSEGTTYGADGTFEIHTPRFSADEYPATISGVQDAGSPFTFAFPSHPVGGGVAKASCTTATLAGSLSGASSSAALSPTYSGCHVSGVAATIKTNGCTYVSRPQMAWFGGGFEGPLDLGCPEGKAIELTTSTCSVTISPTAGMQSAKLQANASAEPKPTVTATLAASGLEYTVTKDGIGCPLSGTGAKKDGTLTGAATVAAANAGAKAIGLYVSGEEEPDHAPLFEAQGYPATISGVQDAGSPFTFAFPSHPVGGGVAKASCTTATLAGSLSGASSSAGLSPTYSGCHVSGVAATIKTNGCSFVAHVESETLPTYSGLLDISCPEGKAIELEGTCGMTISPAVGLGEVEYASASQAGREAIGLTLAASGLEYTVTKDGIGCPLSGTGAKKDGTLTGAATVAAKDANGEPLGVRVSG